MSVSVSGGGGGRNPAPLPGEAPARPEHRSRPATAPSQQLPRSQRASRSRGRGRTTGPAAGGGEQGKEWSLRRLLPPPPPAQGYGLRLRWAWATRRRSAVGDHGVPRSRTPSAATSPRCWEWFAPGPGPASEEGRGRHFVRRQRRAAGRCAVEAVRVSGRRRSLPRPVSAARRARLGPYSGPYSGRGRRRCWARDRAAPGGRRLGRAVAGGGAEGGCALQPVTSPGLAGGGCGGPGKCLRASGSRRCQSLRRLRNGPRCWSVCPSVRRGPGL